MPVAQRPRAGVARAWVQLVRPANILTAWADIAAGSAAALSVGGIPFDLQSFTLLILATTGLYGGGVVLNDVFDAKLDASERPERPIPSRRVARKSAALLGFTLLIVGVAAGYAVNRTAGAWAVGIAVLAVLYDAVSKHHSIIGPLNMGVCRAGNLLLGATLLPEVLTSVWIIGLLPLVYVSAITLVSRAEVHGGSRGTGRLALALLMAVLVALVLMSLHPDYHMRHTAVFVAALAIGVVPAFVRAASKADASSARRAVRAGVLSLILLDATLVAGFAGWEAGAAIAALLPLSMLIARQFSVT